MLLQVLSGSAIVLGLYLIILQFFTNGTPISKPTSSYHIGCYDPGYANNHSRQLEERLYKIQSSIRQNTKLNMYNSKALQPGFQKRVQEIARSFQSFLDQYYKLKSSNDHNINYYNSLRLAKQNYKQCTTSSFFSQQDCLNTWDRYKKSSTQIQDMKKVVNDLIDVKQRKQIDLFNFLVKGFNIDGESVENGYRTKIRLLQEEKNVLQHNISQFVVGKKRLRVDVEYVQADLDELKRVLDDCLNNQQLIIYCNKITQEINQIEQQAPKLTKKQLQTRISKKLLIIDTLQNNIQKSKRVNEIDDILKYETEIKKQKYQLQLLEYQIQHIQIKQQSRCAMCSEDRIRQLRRNISELEGKKVRLVEEESRVEVLIGVYQSKLKVYSERIEGVRKQMEALLANRFCNDQQCKADHIRSREQKQIAVKQLKREILEKEQDLERLQKQNEERIKDMKVYLEGIDSITDCIFKKQYLYELKKIQPKQPNIDQQVITAKRSIVKQLSDFQL